MSSKSSRKRTKRMKKTNLESFVSSISNNKPAGVVTTPTNSTTKIKPVINLSDIDKFIGRTAIKDEVDNINMLGWYTTAERFIKEKLKDEVTKNDIVRTWNLLTRKATGLADCKRLTFNRLNLVIDYKEENISYDKEGKMIRQPGFTPILLEEVRINKAVDAMSKILDLFFKPWHYKIKRFDCGILLWFSAPIKKIVEQKYSPGYLTTYYQTNSEGKYVGGTTIYPTIPTYYSSPQNQAEQWNNHNKTKNSYPTLNDFTKPKSKVTVTEHPKRNLPGRVKPKKSVVNDIINKTAATIEDAADIVNDSLKRFLSG